ncbi:hypothetical protein GS399_15245 [Pedobacter sp. HMF7647]|uniref:Uncharacterized protein n=1 Tax=Hufsiella arboris TaxID=2695275 RepID=A0A7K1YE58_9SPHI|nr:hypothetical protein [Hufsiella arboris]MXV52329.1 hypothetical protein [Hufsiella arboris]
MPNQTSGGNAPENIEELLSLAELIFQQHLEDGEASPLNALQGYNWNATGPTIAIALDKHREAKSLKKQSEQAFEERDILFAHINRMVMASRDLLISSERNICLDIGKWGFDVNETSR